MDKFSTMRVTSEHAAFQILAGELELDLKIRDGNEHLFYADLNKIDTMKYAVVAYEQDEPIGCGSFKEHAADTMEIKRMYVRPANRGKGVASEILAELEKWCNELGTQTCVLETGKNQPEAIEFYKKNRYEIIPNFGRYIDSKNSVCFKKILS